MKKKKKQKQGQVKEPVKELKKEPETEADTTAAPKPELKKLSLYPKKEEGTKLKEPELEAGIEEQEEAEESVSEKNETGPVIHVADFGTDAAETEADISAYDESEYDGSEYDGSEYDETDYDEEESGLVVEEEAPDTGWEDTEDEADYEADEPAGEIVIDMKNIVKRYFIGQPNELEVLHGVDMQVRRGEFVAIVGQSGSGKSTLMNMIGALDRPTEGEYTLDGVDMFRAKDKDLSAIRCKKIGFVFQTYNLVARTSALKNVALPMLYAGIPMWQRIKKAKELLEMVEMGDRMRHQPDELSGGQKQRVAIARAMANDPAIILADEPTGALDSVTGRLIMDIFHKLHEEQGKTIILITHSPELASECTRILTLKDGVIINEQKGSGKRAVL